MVHWVTCYLHIFGCRAASRSQGLLLGKNRVFGCDTLDMEGKNKKMTNSRGCKISYSVCVWG